MSHLNVTANACSRADNNKTVRRGDSLFNGLTLLLILFSIATQLTPRGSTGLWLMINAENKNVDTTLRTLREEEATLLFERPPA